MPVHFFDTCGLQHRYIDSEYSRRVRGLVTRSSSSCFISEWTVLEMSSAFANRSRRQNFTARRFDSLTTQFLNDIAEERLSVVATSQRDIIRARDLLRYAGVVQRRNLKSGDALVATCCLSLALGRQEKITFYTSDWTLFDVLGKIDAFKSRLNLVLLGTPRA